jgi:hypothetical protein
MGEKLGGIAPLSDRFKVGSSRKILGQQRFASQFGLHAQYEPTPNRQSFEQKHSTGYA